MKKILSLLLVLAMALSLVACGGESAEKAPAGEAAAEAPVEAKEAEAAPTEVKEDAE